MASTPLKIILDRQGRKYSWVAQQLRVNPATVSKWASGDRTIPDERADQLADLLGVKYGMFNENCKSCADNRVTGFGPSHVPMSSCQSGSYAHCACDTCF